MFLRLKTSGPRQYLQLVENRREGGTHKQRVLATLGRIDLLAASGQLARLLASGAALCEQALLLSALAEGPSLTLRRIGAPLLFGRLWEETGCRAVIEALAAERRFGFALERAIFAATLHRLMISGSDRACERWLEDYAIPGAEGLALHHFYRAMAWLGEALAEQDEPGRVPRTTKDLLEERLFASRRDLFSELSLVFVDTTSLAFHGRGGASLGRHGHSKDHRPELAQMILAVAMDQSGRPLCTEMLPGNTADVAVLAPLIERLRRRFGLARLCVVADRGMVSEATLAALEAQGVEYIVGVRERSQPKLYDRLLADPALPIPLCQSRADGSAAMLSAKEVRLHGRRYIVCRNEAEAERDRALRQTILDHLAAELAQGSAVGLVRNRAWQRYLRRSGPGPAFVIDAAKVAVDARYDGTFVLRTNTTLAPLVVMMRYRDLWRVEELFRRTKAVLRTRPIYHSSDEAIRGHVFCSFLALVLQDELYRRCATDGFAPAWDEVVRDLDRLQEATIAQNGKTWRVRSDATGHIPRLMRACGIALPPRVQPLNTETAEPAPIPVQPRRGRPRKHPRA